MHAMIACDFDCPGLGEALALRGLDLAPIAPAVARVDPRWAAVALAWRARDRPARALVHGLRQLGWQGPLMLLVAGGGSIADALDAGADEAAAIDAPREIAARLAARLRAPAGILRIGDLAIDRRHRTVARAGRPLALLPREYALLLHLAEHAGHAVARHALLRAVWKLDFDPGTNVVEVHVSRLRARLMAADATPILHTDRGKGYRLSPVFR